GGYCENYTLLNANQVGRLSGPEEATMIASRHGGPNYGADVMENMGSYSGFSLPPRASLDLANAEPGVPITIDVLANDHDSNGDTFSLLSFDSASARGATITRSVGTGPGGRDQIIFTGSNDYPSGLDSFQYRIQDSTGRQALGNVYVKVALSVTGELVAYWTLDETTGTVAGDEVGAAAATLYNGAAWAAGTINNGLSFNGVNQHAKAAINIPESNTAVSFWFKTSQSGGGLYSVVDNGSGHDRHIYLNAGNIKARIYSEETISSTGQNYADNQWHQVVHTYGGVAGGQKLYVDGALIASGTKTSSNFTTQTAIELGYSASSPTPYFTGLLDDVRIWNRALTAAEAQALAQRSGSAHDPAPPYAAIVAGSQGPASLSWLAPPGATSHDVYFGTYAGVRGATTASSEFQGNFSTASFVPTISTPGYYYWRVDERRGTTVFKGAVWYFRYIGTNGSNSFSLTQPTAWWVEGSDTFTQTGVISGIGSLYKDRTGNLILTGANTFTGGTIAHEGMLTLKAPANADWTAPGGPVTIHSGATTKLDLTAHTTQYRRTHLGTTAIQSGGVLSLHGTVDHINSHYLIQTWGGATGSGTIQLNGGGSIAVWTAATNPLSGFTGLLAIQNGRFASNVTSTSTLGGNFDVNIGATGKLDLRSGHFDIDALNGVAGSQVHKSYTGDTINFTIGSGNGSGNFAGTMVGSNYHVIKTGTGTQSLSGTNTYTGTTTVNNGTLVINGSLGNTASTISATATFGGTGTLGGALTNNGTLSPGN
ncbi:MAG TPA: LamG-like jellyroll fold domain-containing protein, partial [Luteolibacter sp.]